MFSASRSLEARTGNHRGYVKTVQEPTSWRIVFFIALFPIAATAQSSWDWRNQEGFSTRRLNACVFAQAAPRTAFLVVAEVAFGVNLQQRKCLRTRRHNSGSGNHEACPIACINERA